VPGKVLEMDQPLGCWYLELMKLGMPLPEMLRLLERSKMDWQMGMAMGQETLLGSCSHGRLACEKWMVRQKQYW
jgi:hypothetical protein